jgi:hypothetical protein
MFYLEKFINTFIIADINWTAVKFVSVFLCTWYLMPIMLSVSCMLSVGNNEKEYPPGLQSSFINFNFAVLIL